MRWKTHREVVDVPFSKAVIFMSNAGCYFNESSGFGLVSASVPCGRWRRGIGCVRPFHCSGLRSCALITPLRRKSSLTPWSHKRLPLLILKTWQCPCCQSLSAEPLHYSLFHAKLDAPLGYLLQGEGAHAVEPCKFRTGSRKHNKGILQVVSRLHLKVSLGEGSEKREKIRRVFTVRKENEEGM